MTKSLALELQPLNVQVNCVLLQHPVSLNSAASSSAASSGEPSLSELAQSLESVAQDQQNAALSHTILFLLSPASALVSGSVLRLQHRLSTSSSSSSSSGGNNDSSAPSTIRKVDATTPTTRTVATDASATAAASSTLDEGEETEDDERSDRVDQV